MRHLAALLLFLSMPVHAQVDHIPRGYGTNYLAISSSFVPSGSVLIFRDSADGKLKLHNSDDSVTTLSPFWSQTTSLGVLTVGPQSDGTMLNFLPSDGYFIPFKVVCGSFANLSGGQPDAVCREGWNVAAGGGQVVSGPGIFDSWERRWEQLVGAFQQERHAQWRDPLNNEWRPISIIGQESSLPGPAPHLGLYLFGTTVLIGSGRDNNSPASLNVQPTITQLASPTLRRALTLDDSGAAQVTLSNTDGTHIAELVLDPNGGTTLSSGSGAIGRWYTQGGNSLQLELDGTTAQLWSGNGGTYVQVTDGQTALYVNSAPILLAQPNQAFFPKLIYHQHDAIGTETRIDTTAGLLLRNTTAATGGAQQQNSPSLVLVGQVWNTAASVSSGWGLDNRPLPGATPTHRLYFCHSTDDTNCSGDDAYVTSDGLLGAKIHQVDDSGSLGTCDASHRNQIKVVDGGVGVTDTLSMCMKSAANSYNWIPIGSGG